MSDFRNLPIRVLISVLLIAMAIGMILWGGLAFIAVIVVLVGIAQWELARAFLRSGVKLLLWPALITTILSGFIVMMEPDLGYFVVFAVIFIMMTVCMAITLLRKDKAVLDNAQEEHTESEDGTTVPVAEINPAALQATTGSLMLFLYPLLPALVMLFASGIGDYHLRLYTLVMGIFCAVFTDIGAYAVGNIVGGRKLCPKISPNKTISGAIGGFIFAGLFGLGVGLIVATPWFQNDAIRLLYSQLFFSRGLNMEYTLTDQAVLPFWVFPIIALLLSGISQVGDLIESGIKRKLGIKDFGSIFMAHGGVLDRMDGILFSAAASTLFFMIVTSLFIVA